MVRLELCNYLNCPKAKECYRTVAEIGVNGYIDFKHICGEWNDYTYQYDIGNKEIRKEEIADCVTLKDT